VPSTIIATFVFLLFPLVTGLGGLSVLIGFTGVATGLALGTMATYTYDVIPEHARARLQTLRRLFGEMGGIAGPLMGGLIADAASPGVAFWAFVPLQAAAGLPHHVRRPGVAAPGCRGSRKRRGVQSRS
jgi:MFS family permease